jgi:hypothetical protein
MLFLSQKQTCTKINLVKTCFSCMLQSSIKPSLKVFIFVVENVVRFDHNEWVFGKHQSTGLKKQDPCQKSGPTTS